MRILSSDPISTYLKTWQWSYRQGNKNLQKKDIFFDFFEIIFYSFANHKTLIITTIKCFSHCSAFSFLHVAQVKIVAGSV
jgi:hypothetical protein